MLLKHVKKSTAIPNIDKLEEQLFLVSSYLGEEGLELIEIE